MYKTSFNGLTISVKGVYSAYNLDQKELESLRRTFGIDSINGSHGNYTVFRDAKRQVFLNLFIHYLWKPISFDIRDDLLKLYGSDRLLKKNIEQLSKKLKDMRLELHVDLIDGKWYIVDYDQFLELLKKLISESE